MLSMSLPNDFAYLQVLPQQCDAHHPFSLHSIFTEFINPTRKRNTQMQDLRFP
jgi:hypothetical protein